MPIAVKTKESGGKLQNQINYLFMKKNCLLTIISAIIALACIFSACKKEPLADDKGKIFRSLGALPEVGIYNNFVEGNYWISDTWVAGDREVIVHTYFRDGSSWLDQKDIDGTKPSNSIYNFTVRTSCDEVGWKSYSSFCASYGSSAFGGLTNCYISGTLDATKKAQIISAFNYIYDTYGSLNGWLEYDMSEGWIPKPEVTVAGATKVVAQSALWMILDYPNADGTSLKFGGIDYITPQYGNPGYYDYRPYIGKGFDEAIAAAIHAANTGYQGSKTVKNLAYLVGPQYPSDVVSIQPQIIPLGGTPPPVLGPAYGSVTATWYDMPAKTYLPRINATLNPKNGNAQFPASYNAGIVYNANHFTYAKVNYAALYAGEVIELAMVVGNKFDYVGKALVSLNNGNIEVTIENFGKGDFGVMAFNKPMTDKFPKNGNIHSQKEADLKKELGATTGFNHDNKTVVLCPAPAADGNIYLYIHCGTIQFWQ
jgi:hypothetical protein